MELSEKHGCIYNEGKKFEVIDDYHKYEEHLIQSGYSYIKAEKCGNVIARLATAGEILQTYSQGGILESDEIAQEGNYILTKADSDGNPVVDGYNHVNSWQVDSEVLYTRYDIPEDGFEGELVLKPNSGEQTFIQVDRDVVFMKPWGENGKLVPQFIEKGGYMNVTTYLDVYGISERDFRDTYCIIE